MLDIRQSQQQRLEQRIAPQQINALKLLQMNIQSLEQEIKNELEENPVLELDEDFKETEGVIEEQKYEDPEKELEIKEDKEEVEWDVIEDSYELEEYDTSYLQERITKEDEEKYEIERFVKNSKSLQEHLLEQANLRFDSEEDKKIAEFIIGNIDDNGFLTLPIEEISRQLNMEDNIEKIEKILKEIQKLEPTGCGARDIREALLAQLEADGKENTLHYEIIEKYYDDFKKRKIRDLARKLDRPVKIIEEVIKEITKYPIYPGQKYTSSLDEYKYVEPDIIVRKDDKGEWIVEINEGFLPKLKINKKYKDSINSKNDRKAKEFLAQKYEKANFIINSIKQRRETLQKVAKAILEYQKDFFEKGEGLKPMTLADIAEMIGVHTATVSRAINSKYILTPYGMYKLKDFFSTSLPKDDSEKEEDISAKEVMKMIEEIIANEDKSKPLSDEKIANILNSKNIKIARRTVAKYRDELGIPPARMRKKY